MTVQTDEAVDAAAEKLDELLARDRPANGKASSNGGAFLRRMLRGRKHPPETNGRPAPPVPKGGGPNALVVIGAAFALGVLAAKVVDWRSHANPRA